MIMDLSSSVSFSSLEQQQDVDIESFQKINPNILKNILRSYFHFLVDRENKDIIDQFVSKKPYSATINVIKKYIKKYKFNHEYLIRLVGNEGYRRTFEYYLTFDISEWLCKSKITDRESHIKCIEQLKDLCVQRDNIHLNIQCRSFYQF